MNMREIGTQLGTQLRSAISLAGDFGRWWWDELLGLVPERWQRHLRQLGTSLIIELDAQGADLRFGNLSTAETLQRVSLDELSGERPWLEPATQARAAKAAQILLLLAQQHVLRKSVSLPLAAEGKLSNVLRFEMDRYTPFGGEQVYFGYRQLRHARTGERIEVDLLVVQREYLDPLLEALNRAGLPANVVSVRASADSSGNLINLLPAGRSRAGNANWRNRRLVPLLALGVVLLLIAWPFYQQQRNLQTLQGEIAQLKGKAEQARSLGTTLEQLQSSREFLLRQQAKAPRTLLLLDELTSLLPDSTWLTRFEDNGSTVRMDGESGEASALISLLEGSSMLKNVRFASPVTTNPGTTRERFSLAAELNAVEATP